MRTRLTGTFSLVIVALVALVSSCASRQAATIVSANLIVAKLGSGLMNQDVRPGPGVDEIRWLSDYQPSLLGSPGDSLVYIMDSGKPGGTLLVVGGTHANELAGMTAATLLVERAVPTGGRLIVIPHLNSSGLSYMDTVNPQPSWIRLEAASGTRYLQYGSRLVHPEHQGRVDPDRYFLPDSPDSLAGSEQRNINRAYPGIEEGPLTQRVAKAVMDIIVREKVSLALDMHEARPSSKLKWMIVANPKNLDLAINTVFDLEDKGILLKIDQSSDEFRGLSHKEWGDRTEAMAFLVETVNPAQEPRVGEPVDQLGHPEYPLWRRVGVQLETLGAIVGNYNAVSSDGTILYDGIPSLEEIEAQGLEAFF
ncbi:MAG: succinylglutamate desuccinylase/aspartoacylase family protein [Spirochaetia bacterium]|jgi:hypothetical protein|nr:succinylglutamate desuccinylase/aspartoacylase family protein [Spirochaetia bacterium]